MTPTEKEMEKMLCDAAASYERVVNYFEEIVADTIEKYDTKGQITVSIDRDGLSLSVTPLDGITFPYTVRGMRELETFKEAYNDAFLNFRDEILAMGYPIGETLSYVRDSVKLAVKELIEQADFIASI